MRRWYQVHHYEMCSRPKKTAKEFLALFPRYLLEFQFDSIKTLVLSPLNSTFISNRTLNPDSGRTAKPCSGITLLCYATPAPVASAESLSQPSYPTRPVGPSLATVAIVISRQKLELSLLAVGVALSRLAFRSHALYDLDSVNFALAIGRFDPRVHQPHPPGYFL
jgi:hypothetical protein